MSFSPFGRGRQISLSDLQDEMNRMFDRMWHGGISTAPLDGQNWAPAIDLVDEPAHFVLSAEVPGLSVDDIEVSFEEGQLVLKGHKANDREEAEEIGFVRHERRFGNFCRRVDIPESVNQDAITARCQRGVLVVTLPKKEIPERRTVRIQVAED